MRQNRLLNGERETGVLLSTNGKPRKVGSSVVLRMYIPTICPHPFWSLSDDPESRRARAACGHLFVVD